MRSVFFLLLIFLAPGAHAAGTDSLPASVTTAVPQKVKITDLEDIIATSDHPLIINFWATFCAPCNKEIPYFQSTVDRYRDQQVELVLVSLDLPDYFPQRISAFVESHSYKARIVWLNETNADYFCPKVDPRWTGGIPCS